MSKKNIFQLIVLVLLIISVISLLFTINWNSPIGIVSFCSTFIASIASLVGIFISNQFEFKFNDTSNLNIEDGQIKIRFNRKEHGMSKSPKVSIFCFRNYDKLYEPAYGGAKVDIEGNVIISIPSNCFEQGGKIVIQ